MERWYTLYTKPRAEFQVSDALAEKGIEVYVPSILVSRRRRKNKVRVPFFPRYIFARMDLEKVGISTVAWTPGLTDLVKFDGRPAIVPERIIETLKERLALMEQGDYAATFQPGDRVRVLDGPFRDLEAVFDARLSGSERVRILLNVLGRMTKVEIEARQIAKLYNRPLLS